MLRPTVLSEVGLRSNNEDAVFASSRLVAVADGVGGAAAGELASQLTILKMVALDKRRLLQPLDRELSNAVADANDLISLATLYEPRNAGMATTLTAVALSNDRCYIVANIGDSRTYLLRDQRLRRLTRDDSLVQELIDQDLVSECEAHQHPQRSVVLRVLNGAEREPPGLRTFPALEGDRLLLCSDGVTDYLTDAQVAEYLAIEESAEAVRCLVAAALASGSRDNVSAVVADVMPRTDSDDGWLDALPLSLRAG
jgi:serine/threonine protein phosphatase PrpC